MPGLNQNKIDWKKLIDEWDLSAMVDKADEEIESQKKFLRVKKISPDPATEYDQYLELIKSNINSIKTAQ